MDTISITFMESNKDEIKKDNNKYRIASETIDYALTDQVSSNLYPLQVITRVLTSVISEIIISSSSFFFSKNLSILSDWLRCQLCCFPVA